MACAKDPAQYQRKEGTSHGPFILLHREGAAGAGDASATNGYYSTSRDSLERVYKAQPFVLSLSKGVRLGGWQVAETRSSFDKLRTNGFR